MAGYLYIVPHSELTLTQLALILAHGQSVREEEVLGYKVVLVYCEDDNWPCKYFTEEEDGRKLLEIVTKYDCVELWS